MNPSDVEETWWARAAACATTQDLAILRGALAHNELLAVHLAQRCLAWWPRDDDGHLVPDKAPLAPEVLEVVLAAAPAACQRHVIQACQRAASASGVPPRRPPHGALVQAAVAVFGAPLVVAQVTGGAVVDPGRAAARALAAHDGLAAAVAACAHGAAAAQWTRWGEGRGAARHAWAATAVCASLDLGTALVAAQLDRTACRTMACSHAVAPNPGVATVVLVPFRDSDPRQERGAQLRVWVAHMAPVLDEALGAGTWAVLVLDQAPGRAFARGRLLNAGALLAAARFPGATALVLHDVDLLPDAARAAAMAAPPFGHLRALNTDSAQYRGCAMYTGGIAAVAPATFAAANGFQNAFGGWGGEDDCFREAVGVVAGRAGLPKSAWWTGPTPGSVVDLEWEAAAAAKAAGASPPYRQGDDPAAKMPKADRAAVRAMARATGFAGDGMRQLVFAVTGTESVLGPGMTLVPVDVHVVLPPNWGMAVSKTCGLPFYFCRATGKATYVVPQRPPGPSPGPGP
jgi:hypothetical protein